MEADELLRQILPHLDRSHTPDSQWPDGKGEYWPLCPFHSDRSPGSFSVSVRGYRCFACDTAGSLTQLAEHMGIVGLHDCTPVAGLGAHALTVADYAAAKRLPVPFLRRLGLRDQRRRDDSYICIPYPDASGEVVATRYRFTMAGPNRFRWSRGSKVVPYALWALDRARDEGYVVMVEGESDTHTLLHYDIPCLGIPGATMWKSNWRQYVEGLRVFIWREPDAGGEQFAASVGADLPGALILTPPAGTKDVSEYHLQGGDVVRLIRDLMADATPLSMLRQETVSRELAALREVASPLLACPTILEAFGDLVRELGLAGEERNAKLLYLVVTSRLLDRPVSVVVKGPSSGGKSFLVETVLRAFPDSASHALSSMSERALAYSREPLDHRMLVLYEAAGLTSDFATYLLRSLLSEGRIRYEMVEKTADGLVLKLIEREGPTTDHHHNSSQPAPGERDAHAVPHGAG